MAFKIQCVNGVKRDSATKKQIRGKIEELNLTDETNRKIKQRKERVKGAIEETGNLK